MLEKPYLRIVNRLQYLQWSLRYRSYKNKYNISDDFVFNGPDIRLYGEGNIIIGKRSHIGSYSTIQSREGCEIIIGNNCRISHNVRMYSRSDVADQDFSKKELNKKIGNIIIGDHVWVGVNVYIGPSVEIGENSVVVANSVVIKDVPPFSIAGGIPAKVIKYKNNI